MNIVVAGDGWSATDVICGSGPHDRPFEEEHGAIAIAVVLEGSFQYRSRYGSELMSPGSLLLGNCGQCFECRHEHGTGDRCLSFQYAPEYFERAGIAGEFSVHRLPPLAELAHWTVQAKLASQNHAGTSLEELAHGLADAAHSAVTNAPRRDSVAAADERRISASLRFIEANLAEPLSLRQLASLVQLSDFHFLRVFKQVTLVTPHRYILRARLRQAALHLKASASPVLEIALDAGFHDLSHFYRLFRGEFGSSPAQYRKR